MKIAISADSTCDLPKDLVDKYDIKINAMPFSLGENDLRHDGVTGTSKDVFDYVDKTGQLPTTSAFNEYEYTEHFKNILKSYDEVIHISFSYEVSSTGMNAKHAAENMEHVYTIDSQNLSMGFGLLVLKAAILAKEGYSAQEIVDKIEELKSKVHTSFIIDTLKYLHKGGRCSSVANISAKILSIKPKITVLNGKMVVTKKYMGSIKTSALKYCDDVLKEFEPNKDFVSVVTSSPIGIEDKIIQKLKDFGFKQIIVGQAGPSISIHCGKGTIGIIYIKN